MSDIVKINNNEIPSDAKLFKVGEKTKTIYLNGSKNYGYIVDEEQTATIAQGKTEKVEISSTKLSFFAVYDIKIKLYKNNSLTKEITVGQYDGKATMVNGSYKVTLDEEVEIKKDFSEYIFYTDIPKLPPPEIIPIDKAPSTASLNDITNYINKTIESIKSCKSYIAYIINNKGGSATDTETLESLIDKLNDVFQISPDNPTPPLDMMVKPSKLRLSARFHEINYKLQEINDLLKVSSDNLKTIMDANNLMYEPTDNFSTLVKKLNNEPINFLLEGTKVRDILNKHLGATTYAPEVGSSYCYVCFTNIKRQSWTDLKEDLSLKKDGSISLYYELVDKSDRNYHNYYYIYSENKIYANKDSSYIFNTKKNGFKSIDFENIYFDYVENASYMFYNFGEGYGTGIFNINNLKLKNAKNINYIFNGSNIGNINFIVYDKMESYSNFSPEYSTITLDYVNDKSKKIAESIIASNNNLKLGTLVTQ